MQSSLKIVKSSKTVVVEAEGGQSRGRCLTSSMRGCEARPDLGISQAIVGTSTSVAKNMTRPTGSGVIVFISKSIEIKWVLNLSGAMFHIF